MTSRFEARRREAFMALRVLDVTVELSLPGGPPDSALVEEAGVRLVRSLRGRVLEAVSTGGSPDALKQRASRAALSFLRPRGLPENVHVEIVRERDADRLVGLVVRVTP